MGSRNIADPQGAQKSLMHRFAVAQARIQREKEAARIVARHDRQLRERLLERFAALLEAWRRRRAA